MRHESAPNPRGTYLAVADAIRREIASDPGIDRVRPVRELMAAYGVSRGLVTRALKLLQHEGLVASDQGSGWFVVRDRDDARPLADRMRDMFVTDGLTPGSAWPSEAELCARFGRSRTAVRTALAELEGAGLLERAPGKPRIVRALPEG